MAAIVWNATVNDLYKVEGKAELVDGRILQIPPGGDCYGVSKANILVSLHEYAKRNRKGVVFGGDIVFLCDLPNRRSFSPDCCYYTGPRAGKKFLPQPPIFAVEVRGQEDEGRGAERRMAHKRADYFAAGTQVVWDVDTDTSEIRVYRATDPEIPIIYGPGTMAEADPAVPGWSFAVDELLT